jgi:dephospho-CoA kinase
LAAKAFADDEQRATLNGIVHPLVARRRQEIIDGVSGDAVIVEDIPLLVETGMAPLFPLVVVVYADEETRVRRLVDVRGMPEGDARARIRAQASDAARRAIADVVLDNSGSRDEIVALARDLWTRRVLPLADNIRARRAVRPAARLVPYDPEWPADAERIANRIRTACGGKVIRVDHIGSTAVPGFEAKDVVDVQVTVESLDVADEIADSLAAVGYPRIEHIDRDVAHGDDASRWRKRVHGAADPGRPANVHIRVDGWPNQRFALLFPAWLTAHPQEREEYLAVKRRALEAPVYAEAKEPWLAQAYPRALAWADATGWRP